MRAIVICLLIFIMGYSIGNKHVAENSSTYNLRDTITKTDSIFKSVSCQVSNLDTDSVTEIEQERLLSVK